jgi:hypothetical protein
VIIIYADKPTKEFIMPVMKKSKGLPALAEVVAADKATKKPSKKTYYCVMAEFYANGTAQAAITTRICREKPRNRDGSNPIMRFSNTWLETEVKRLPVAGSVA